MISQAIDLIIFACGIYLLSTVIKIKTTGEINQVLLGKNLDIKRCKDVEGYKKFLYPKAMILSVATIVYGGLGLINTYLFDVTYVYYAWILVMIAVLIWYFKQSKKGVQKFWGLKF